MVVSRSRPSVSPAPNAPDGAELRAHTGGRLRHARRARETLSRRPTREIFSREFLRATVLLCIAAFMAQFVIVYVVTWMPLVLASIGMPVTKRDPRLGRLLGRRHLRRTRACADHRQGHSYGWLVVTFFVSAVSVAGIGYLGRRLVCAARRHRLHRPADGRRQHRAQRLCDHVLSDQHSLDRHRLGGGLGPDRRHRRRAVRHRAGQRRPHHRGRLMSSPPFLRSSAARPSPWSAPTSIRRRVRLRSTGKTMHGAISQRPVLARHRRAVPDRRVLLPRSAAQLSSHQVDDHVKRLTFFKAPFPRATFWTGRRSSSSAARCCC